METGTSKNKNQEDTVNESYENLVDTISGIERALAGSNLLKLNLTLKEIIPILIFIFTIAFGIGSNWIRIDTTQSNFSEKINRLEKQVSNLENCQSVHNTKISSLEMIVDNLNLKLDDNEKRLSELESIVGSTQNDLSKLSWQLNSLEESRGN